MTRIMVLLVSLMATTLAILQAGPAAAAGIPEIVEGKALIAFYRKQRMAGAAIQFRVNENGQPIGSLTNGSVLLRDLDPGNYTFSAFRSVPVGASLLAPTEIPIQR